MEAGVNDKNGRRHDTSWRWYGFPTLVLAAFHLLGCSTTTETSYDGAFSVLIENDTITGSDNNYTNGMGFSWTTNEVGNYDSDGFIRKWTEFWSFLPFVDPGDSQTYASWTLGQEMHTPDDISDPNPPLGDQPYAGVLYVDSILHARKGRWGHAWSLRLGVVGPSSQADLVQKEFHELSGAQEPMGWDTQLPDEPIVNVSYTAGYLLTEGRLGTANWRIVPMGGISLGNYATALSAGLYTELGWNLSQALGTSTLRSGLDTALTAGAGPQEFSSLSLFAGFGGNAIAHYLPLDGTVFRDSRSVGSDSFVGAVTGGVSFRRGRFVASLSVSYSTDTFAGEREDVSFGALNLAWSY